MPRLKRRLPAREGEEKKFIEIRALGGLPKTVNPLVDDKVHFRSKLPESREHDIGRLPLVMTTYTDFKNGSTFGRVVYGMFSSFID
jgi:hypothetical protein